MAAFNGSFIETIKLFTRASDSYVNGRLVKGAEVQTNIMASVQPVSGSDRQLLPDGFRGKEVYTVFTETNNIQFIQTNTAIIVDSAEIEYKSKRYSIISMEKWEYLIPHHKITMVAK